MADEERKIIIDEGWKARVEREKSEAAAEKQDSVGPARPSAKPAPPESAAELAPETAPEEGEPSLWEQHLSMIAAQTMMALGLIADEQQQQVMVDLGLAHHLIETLIMLREKTKGNLDPGEQRLIGDTLAELQRIFAVRAKQAQESMLKQRGIDPNQLKTPPGM